jgi:hypothetical protein
VSAGSRAQSRGRVHQDHGYVHTPFYPTFEVSRTHHLSLDAWWCTYFARPSLLTWQQRTQRETSPNYAEQERDPAATLIPFHARLGDIGLEVFRCNHTAAVSDDERLTRAISLKESLADWWVPFNADCLGHISILSLGREICLQFCNGQTCKTMIPRPYQGIYKSPDFGFRTDPAELDGKTAQ